MSRREILSLSFSSAAAVILLTFVLSNSCTTSTDCKEGRRTSLLSRRSPYWTLAAEPHAQRSRGIRWCQQEMPRPPAACDGALERGSWARSAERIRFQYGGEGIAGPPRIRLRGAGPDQGGSGESEGEGDDIEEFRNKFLEMFSNGGLAQGGGMGEGASYDGDGDGAIPGGSIGGMAYIDEDGTINITTAVQIGPQPDTESYIKMFDEALLKHGAPLSKDEIHEGPDSEGEVALTHTVVMDKRHELTPPPSDDVAAHNLSACSHPAPLPLPPPPPPPLSPPPSLPRGTGVPQTGQLGSAQSSEQKTDRLKTPRKREEEDDGSAGGAKRESKAARLAPPPPREDVQEGLECERCSLFREDYPDTPHPELIDHRFDTLVPEAAGARRGVFEGIRSLRDGGRLVIRDCAGGHCWRDPIVISGEDVEYADYEKCVKMAENHTWKDNGYHPGTLCPVSNAVIGRKPLRVFGAPPTEDEHSARLGEAAGVAMWGPMWLEKGAAGSFTGVNLGFNGTGGSLSGDMVDEVMKETGDGDVGEGMKEVIRGFGFDPDDQNVWEWASELLDGMRNDTECFTMEPCIQMWEGPWLFSQSSVKCASGVALALCHYSDLLGERCHFGGLGQGFYTYREGTREGQRRLEASFGITMIENAACKLHDTCIAHVHDIAINALGGAKMEMARCKVSGSTHGVGLSQTANVKASASRFQGMDRGTFNPSECDNATLSLDGCTVQGRMWADEKHAKGLTSQGCLTLKGRDNQFVPGNAPSKQKK